MQTILPSPEGATATPNTSWLDFFTGVVQTAGQTYADAYVAAHRPELQPESDVGNVDAVSDHEANMATLAPAEKRKLYAIAGGGLVLLVALVLLTRR